MDKKISEQYYSDWKVGVEESSHSSEDKNKEKEKEVNSSAKENLSKERSEHIQATNKAREKKK